MKPILTPADSCRHPRRCRRGIAGEAKDGSLSMHIVMVLCLRCGTYSYGKQEDSP